MDGRSLILVLALAISGAGLAGCIEAPAFLSDADTETTALDARSAADDAAKAWNADAKLASVMTFELTSSTDPRIPLDPEVGNGRAMAWWFVYCVDKADAMDVRAFRVDANGTVTEERDAAALAAGAPTTDMSAIPEWKVDSDKALEAAKTNDSFRLAAQGFNATVVEGVAHHEGKTAWWIVAGSVDGIVVASVDAIEGALLEVQELDMSFAMPQVDFATAGPQTFAPEPVHLQGEGTVGGSTTQEFPFTIATPMEGELAVTFTQGSVADGLHWAILDAEGELVDNDHLRSWQTGENEYSTDVEIEAPGDYVLVFEYMSWTPVDTPLSMPVDFAFTLDLAFPGVELDDEEER